MGCWEEIDVASTSAIAARGWAEGFVEFAVECDAAITALSCAYVDNQMVEKRLSLCKRVRDQLQEGWVKNVTYTLPTFPLCPPFSPGEFLQVIGGFVDRRRDGCVGWER